MNTYPPMHGKQTVTVDIPMIEVMTYDFRVVEHLDENDKVIKYVMQLQVWSHKPNLNTGNTTTYSTPTLIRDWHDVPRVQMKNGVIVNNTSITNLNKPTANNVLPNGKGGQVITTTPNGTKWVDEWSPNAYANTYAKII